MRWLQISVDTTAEYAEVVSQLFNKHCTVGGTALQYSGGYNPDEGESPPNDASIKVIGYLPASAASKEPIAIITAMLRLLSLMTPLPDLQVVDVDENDWELEPFSPLRIGERLLIAPHGKIPTTLRDKDVLISIDPGIAFGTGQHPTTKMILEEMEKKSLKGTSVLDVGTGSGILSIVAAKLGAADCIGLDTDPQAVSQAVKNSHIARVEGACRFLMGTLPSTEIKDGSFDLVLCNISALMVVELCPYLLAAVTDSGNILASGLLDERREEVEEAIRVSGGQIVNTKTSQSWTLLDVKRDR